jgi:hypothetical protein
MMGQPFYKPRIDYVENGEPQQFYLMKQSGIRYGRPSFFLTKENAQKLEDFLGLPSEWQGVGDKLIDRPSTNS